ncbi:class I SAM-dependent methyltransferase [Patescibacteria group bacterium]|nr:class I SAM-dependent methyltransferase [Patescibacteria group bacterium]
MDNKNLEKLKKIVLDSYELTAEHFSSTRSKIAAPDFIWASEQIKADDFVLDAGCGNGRLLDYIKNNPDRYLGIDQSSSLVDIAKNLHPGYSFKKTDLISLAIPSQKFSLIFCSAVLSHIPGRKDRIKALQNFLTVSSPGARLVISFWKMKGKYKNNIYLNFFKKIIGQYQFPLRELVFPWKDSKGKETCLRYYHYFTKKSFKQEILRAGWKIETEHDDRHNYWVIAVKE